MAERRDPRWFAVRRGGGLGWVSWGPQAPPKHLFCVGAGGWVGGGGPDTPDWRAYFGCRDAGEGFGERGEVEVCQVVHDVFAHAGEVGRVGLFQPREPGWGEDGQLAAPIGFCLDPLDQSLVAKALD